MAQKYPKTLLHNGTIIVFAIDDALSGKPQIAYAVHVNEADNQETDTSWTEQRALPLPREIATLGRGLVAVRLDEPVPTGDAGFEVVSDGDFVHVFRSSPTQSLYWDKFVFDQTLNKLVNATQVRYRRSRKAYLPLDRRDTFGARDMNDALFLEPTVELRFPGGVVPGRFCVAILPTELSGTSRWQLLCQNAHNGKLDSFSILRSQNGGFDVGDCLDPETGTILPNATFVLTDAAGTALALASGPAICRYDQQEWQEDEYGSVSLQKREIRVMAALAVGAAADLAWIDFGLGRDGRLAQVGDQLPLAPPVALQGALRFDPGVASQVDLPAIATGPSMTLEAWLLPSTITGGARIIATSAADADVAFTLGLEDGVPYFAGPGGGLAAGDTALSVHNWSHLAAVWREGEGPCLYVNGQPFDIGNGCDGRHGTAPQAGIRLGGADGISGDLAMVRLWNEARSHAQVLAWMNAIVTDKAPDWPHLVGAWPMNEPSDDQRFTTVVNQCATGTAGDGVLVGATWVASRAPTCATGVPLAIDSNGLSYQGGILGYASTRAAPSLVEGPDTLLHLYFSDVGTQQACAAHFSQVASRSTYLLPWIAADVKEPANTQSGQLRFVARIAGTAMNNTSSDRSWVQVKKSRQLCTVVLTSDGGYVETWPDVPLLVPDFMQVINGQAVQLSSDPAQDDGVLIYDYTKVVVHAAGGRSGPLPAAGRGSAIYQVFSDAEPDNGMPALVQEASDSKPVRRGRTGAGGRWLPQAPPLGLSMADLGQYVQVRDSAAMGTYRGSLVLERDVTLEAWINPVGNQMDEVLNLAVVNKTGITPRDSAQYIVGLDQGRLYAGKGDVVQVASHRLPTGQGWQHVAASYRTSFGIALGGARYLNAGNDESLDTADAVTVEAWVRPDRIGSEQVVLSKAANGVQASWSLFIDASGKLGFRVYQATQTGVAVRTAVSRTALQAGSWVHVAGVYDVAYTRQVAIAFDNGSYVKLPQVGAPPTTGVTVMAWIKRSQSGSNTEEVLFSSLDARAPCVFVLSLYQNKPQFAVSVGGKDYLVADSTVLRRDDWVHIAATYDAVRGIGLVIDGVPVPPSFAAGAGAAQRAGTPNRGGLGLARSLQGEAPSSYSVGGIATRLSFVGSMNEVSLWDRGLALDEIRQKILQPLASNERGLAGYWRFNDLFGTTVMDVAGTANGTMVAANFIRVDKGAFAHKVFIDGVMEAFERVIDPLVISTASLTMGAGVFTDYLQGALSESRLWKIGRMNWQVEFFRRRVLEPGAMGLLAHWSFDTGQGSTVFDEKGNSNASILDGSSELSEEVIDAMWITTSFRSGWSFFINGDPIESLAGSLPPGGYGDQQVTLGAFVLRSSITRFFTGQVSQLRIWKTQRTGAQVRSCMFTRLSGKEADLAAFWPIDNGSSRLVADMSGWGNTGTLAEKPTWQLCTAPAGIEEPAILCVPGDTARPENLKSAFAAATGCYGLMQNDARGGMLASLLRTLSLVDAADGALALFADFRMGTLQLQYIGQAQTDPTLIGYIEGAPPLPAENMKIYPGDPLSYVAASSILVDETHVKSFSYGASRDNGLNMDLSTRLGLQAETETSVGIGVQQKVLSVSAGAGVALQTDASVNWLAEGMASDELTTSARKHLQSRGAWTPNTYQIDNGIGDLHYPDNTGYALVRSGTADLFAMRLQDSGALVGYSARPNPDIPEDMNIIMFRVNDRYVKNGTLDGWIGFQPDSAYPHLQPGSHASYFQPLQAYAMKASIEREEKQRVTRFENFDAAALGQGLTLFKGGTVIALPGQSLVNALLGIRRSQSLSVQEWQERTARRSMVNTYVWTAQGGLYAEQQQFMAVREESSGGAFSLSVKAGLYQEASVNIGPTFSLDAMFGTTITTQATKLDHDSSSFGMEVDLADDQRYIGLIEEDADGELVYTSKPSPGKVRGYRFMSFYRAPSQQNFAAFRDVVDQDWLTGQGAYAGRYDPDAQALRTALRNPNSVWRVLHRVTYVSRTPLGPQDQGQSVGADVQLPDEDSVVCNAVLISQLPADLDAPNPMAGVGARADALLAEWGKDPVWGTALLARRSEHKEDVMRYMRSYYGLPS